MQTTTESNMQREGSHIPLWLGLCFFLATAAFFLWQEHRAHMLGVLPYLLLLACPIVHLLMHRGHGGHSPSGAGRERHVHQR